MGGLKSNIKCMKANHQECEIQFYCETCNDMMMCIKCFPFHNSHSILLYEENVDIIRNNLKSSTMDYNEEISFLKRNISEVENHLNYLENKMDMQIKEINELYKKLHKILQVKENNSVLQIKTTKDKNRHGAMEFISKIENKIQKCNSLIEIDNKKVEDNQIIDTCIQIKNIMKNVNEINCDIKPFNYNILPFENINLNINTSESIELCHLINNQILIQNEYITNVYKNKLPKNFELIDKTIFQINDEDEKSTITKTLCQDMLLYDSSEFPSEQFFSINSTVNSILVQDCNNFKKLEIPSNVKKLYIHCLNKLIEIESLPTTVTSLYFLNNFQQKINKDIIQDSVNKLEFNNIELPLEKGSIPSSVKTLIFKNGYKHRLYKGIIPKKLEKLKLNDIVQPLDSGSIPSVKELIFGDGYRHKISKGIIPEGVEILKFYDILQPIDIGSIPATVKKLTFGYGYKHPIKEGIIPNGVDQIVIDKISLIEANSIPSSVSFVSILESKPIFISSLIPENVTTLLIHDEENEMYKDIPKSVKVLYLNRELYCKLQKMLDINIQIL